MFLTQKTMGIPNWLLLAAAGGGLWYYNKKDKNEPQAQYSF